MKYLLLDGDRNDVMRLMQRPTLQPIPDTGQHQAINHINKIPPPLITLQAIKYKFAPIGILLNMNNILIEQYGHIRYNIRNFNGIW